MKKFTSFIKDKSARRDHFTWADGDVVTDESLDEWTADKPLKHSGYDHEKTYRNDPHRHEFAEHDKNLSTVHHEHMSYYKGDSYSTNHLLRRGHLGEHQYMKYDHIHDHIHHMDHVTSYQTKHHHTTFRGGVPTDIHKFKPGHKFQDHGYTGSSFNHHVAANFASNYAHKTTTPHGKKIIHVIHSPKGSKVHYIDHGQKSGSLSTEHELVHHRGTKFKVTHHSEDREHHYIHSRVVGNKHKKMPRGTPGKSHSNTGHAEHEKNELGVQITKHDEHPFQKHGHTITMHITPEQQKGIAALKKKALLDKSIANSKEKT